MGRIFNQKEWLEELDETGPEKRRKASNYKCKTKLLDNGRGSETSRLDNQPLFGRIEDQTRENGGNRA